MNIRKFILGSALGATLVAAGALATWFILAVISIGPQSIGTSPVTTALLTATTGSTCVGEVDGAGFGLTRLDLGPAPPSSNPWKTASLCVENPAAFSETYAAESTHTNPVLADALVLRVTSAGVAATPAEAGALPCVFPSISSDGLTGLGALEEVYFGAYSDFGFGNIAGGLQAGDRTLAAGEVERLCFEVRLPDTADSSVAGLTNDVMITLVGSP